MNESKVHYYKMKYENNKFYIDYKELEQLITEKTKYLLLNSPHNPTGLMLND